MELKESGLINLHPDGEEAQMRGDHEEGDANKKDMRFQEKHTTRTKEVKTNSATEV